ncbi:MAG TPA: ferrochelatase [Bryobacteraceae bacterium]|nr:ferrochelatase [Bryobacteraceae bacterium]
MTTETYDAVLILSFGGTEKPDEVIPFLENVLRGRGVPHERMLEVAEHYYHFGGKSPINDQNRALIAALTQELVQHGPRLPIYWGNRNWHPFLTETLRQMQADGIRHALAFTTSVFSSYSGCRQYLEDIERSRAEIGDGAPQIDKLRSFYNHPLFIEAEADRVRAAIDRIPPERRAGAQLLFTAHSVPLAMAESSDYRAQLDESCRLVAENLGINSWRLVYQSRSGPPGQPWLEPDVGDVLRETQPGTDIIVVPIGFISDHMEVLFDLDTEARAISEERRLLMVRAATVGVHPQFLAMIRELIRERMGLCEARAIGKFGPNHNVCPANCCPAPPRRPSSARSDSSPRAIAQR